MKTFEKPYEAKYPQGSRVRIASRERLVQFQSTWRLHNSLLAEQLEEAGRFAEVGSVGYYHGGDPLYCLLGIPGTWHECCLEGRSRYGTMTSDRAVRGAYSLADLASCGSSRSSLQRCKSTAL